MSKIDSTISEAASNRFYLLYHDIIKEVVKTTQFSLVEAQSMLMVYYKFVLANGTSDKTLSQSQFFPLFRILKVYDDATIHRIMQVVSPESKVEFPPLAWVRLISIFTSTDFKAKAQFIFQVYDRQNSGYLNRDVIAEGVQNFFHIDDENELREFRLDMIELLFKKFDVDNDGLISYEDYLSVVMEQPLLIEFLGKCLPDSGALPVLAYCMNLLSLIRPPREFQLDGCFSLMKVPMTEASPYCELFKAVESLSNFTIKGRRRI